MLRINNIDYNDIEVIIDFERFEAYVDGRKRKGKALDLTCIAKDFKLNIETVYDINWIKDLKENDKKDISKYIVCLFYEDKNNFMILNDKCICSICKINNKTYNFLLTGMFDDYEKIFDNVEKLNIEFEYNFEI